MKLSETELARIEFNDADYEALRRYASERDLSVEEAVRAALGELEPQPDGESESVATNMRELESIAEERGGDDSESTQSGDL